MSYSSGQTLQGPAQDVLTRRPGQEMDLGAGQVDGGWQDVETVDPTDAVTGIGRLHRPHEDIVERRRQGTRGPARSSRSGRPGGRGRRAGPGIRIRPRRYPREWTVVVLATPPFWLATATTRATRRSLGTPDADGRVISAASSLSSPEGGGGGRADHRPTPPTSHTVTVDLPLVLPPTTVRASDIACSRQRPASKTFPIPCRSGLCRLRHLSDRAITVPRTERGRHEDRRDLGATSIPRGWRWSTPWPASPRRRGRPRHCARAGRSRRRPPISWPPPNRPRRTSTRSWSPPASGSTSSPIGPPGASVPSGRTALVARLRARTTTTNHPPAPVMAMLGEIVVHGEDIRRPLGICPQGTRGGPGGRGRLLQEVESPHRGEEADRRPPAPGVATPSGPPATAPRSPVPWPL